MKRDTLLGTLLLSAKRRGTLTSLLEGGKDLDELKDDLDATSSGLRPQIKILKERGLIEERETRDFELTDLGRLLAEGMRSFLETVQVIDRHEEFWQNHDLEGIPPHLQERIREFSGAQILEHPEEALYEPHDEFFENIEGSDWVKGISPVYHPKYPEFFHSVASEGTDVSIILNREVFRKAKEKDEERMEDFLASDSANLFLYEDDLLLASGIAPGFASITLYFEDGRYDTRRDMVSESESAVGWADDLFEYYRENSTKVETL